MNARDYQNVLNDYLLPHCEEIWEPRFMFQQESDSVHATNSTFEWFLFNDVHSISRPAVSLD